MTKEDIGKTAINGVKMKIVKLPKNESLKCVAQTCIKVKF